MFCKNMKIKIESNRRKNKNAVAEIAVSSLKNLFFAICKKMRDSFLSTMATKVNHSKAKAEKL